MKDQKETKIDSNEKDIILYQGQIEKHQVDQS
jgi:hypothetical protein